MCHSHIQSHQIFSSHSFRQSTKLQYFHACLHVCFHRNLLPPYLAINFHPGVNPELGDQSWRVIYGPAKRRCLSSARVANASFLNCFSFIKHFLSQHCFSEHRKCFTSCASQQVILEAWDLLRCILDCLGTGDLLLRCLLLLLREEGVLFMQSWNSSSVSLLSTILLCAILLALRSLQ